MVWTSGRAINWTVTGPLSAEARCSLTLGRFLPSNWEASAPSAALGEDGSQLATGACMALPTLRCPGSRFWTDRCPWRHWVGTRTEHWGSGLTGALCSHPAGPFPSWVGTLVPRGQSVQHTKGRVAPGWRAHVCPRPQHPDSGGESRPQSPPTLQCRGAHGRPDGSIYAWLLLQELDLGLPLSPF